METAQFFEMLLINFDAANRNSLKGFSKYFGPASLAYKTSNLKVFEKKLSSRVWIHILTFDINAARSQLRQKDNSQSLRQAKSSKSWKLA